MGKVTALMVAYFLMVVLCVPGLFAPARAAPLPPNSIVIPVTLTNTSGNITFVPRVIQVIQGYQVNMSFKNADTRSQSFTIREAGNATKYAVNTGNITGGATARVSFMVNATASINLIQNGSLNTTAVPVETGQAPGFGTGIIFFSLGHPNATGYIVLATGASKAAKLPTLYTTVRGETINNAQVFVPRVIPAAIGVMVVVNFINSDTQLQHSFTINSATGAPTINSGILNSGGTATLRFVVNDTNKINAVDANGTVSATATTVETTSITGVGQGIEFYCIPHRAAGMTGVVTLGSPTAATVSAYPGFQLWAFWIGSIAMVAMFIFMGVTYVVIKGSSKRNVDQRDHIRRGLP